MRGLDNLTYYRHAAGRPGELINDTGCGNTIACDHPVVQRLILDSLRHFVLAAGVDGFRFDLASILGRDMGGFRRDAALFSAISADPILCGRVLIAEPWDTGPGGYQLGNFPHSFLEWNDRARTTSAATGGRPARGRRPCDRACRLLGQLFPLGRDGHAQRQLHRRP